MPAFDTIRPEDVARILSNQDLGHEIGEFTYLRMTEPTRGQRPMGCIVSHLYRENQDAPVHVHQISVTFDDPANAGVAGPRWKTHEHDGKLTLDPGLRCECGWVGYVRLGAWVSRGNVGEIIPEA